MKNYYEILKIAPDSDDSIIRSQYRKLAMEYHPDRNPDRPDAEEKFRDIAEAYGVLSDPVKRREYDLFLKSGRHTGNTSGDGFGYSQETILRDLFQDPRFQQMFSSVLDEFQRAGLKAGPEFVKRSFFGNRGGIVIGGLFLFGRLAGPALIKRKVDQLGEPQALMRKLGRGIGKLLSGEKGEDSVRIDKANATFDQVYHLHLTAKELAEGKDVHLKVGPDKPVLRINIPAGSRPGRRLRLRGRGRKPHGDMFIVLNESENA